MHNNVQRERERERERERMKKKGKGRVGEERKERGGR